MGSAALVRKSVIRSLLLAPLALFGRADAVVPTGFVDQLVVGGLANPVAMAWLPDGRMLITEQFTANVEVLPVGAGSSTTIFTIPDVVSGSERGLLGVAVDPDWPTRPYLYFNFSHSGSVIYVRMYTVTGDLTDPSSTNLTLSSPYNILTDIPDQAFNHNGGTVHFDLDDMLLVSTGDDANMCTSQILTSLSGNILRLDVSSLPGVGSGPPAKATITPPDNPFPGPDANTQLIYCYGLRNPFRFTVDSVTGNLYIGDVGQGSWEEFDEASGGENFGWPHREGAHTGPGTGCPGSGGTDPIWEYPNGAAASVIGGPRYRQMGSNPFPNEYEGDLFVHDYYEGNLRRLTFDGGTWDIAPSVPGQPSAANWATGLGGAAQLLVGPDGSLYYVSQFSDQVRRIRNTDVTSVGPQTNGSPIAISTFPNPTGGFVRVSYRNEGGLAERLSIYDVEGARVAKFSIGELNSEITWDGRDVQGNRVAPGVYFLRLEGSGYASPTKKVTIRH